jgi:hypothetical protein
MSLKGAVPGISKTGEKRRGLASPPPEAAHVGPQALELFQAFLSHGRNLEISKSSWLADGKRLLTW